MLQLNPKQLPSTRLLLTLFLCLLASLLKFIVAWQTSSLAVLSDASYSLLAVSVHLAALLADWWETRPDLPGDIRAARKLQTSVIMVLSTILALTAWEIVGAAYDRQMYSQTQSIFTSTGAVALFCTVISQSAWFWFIKGSGQGRWTPLVHEIGWGQACATGLALLALFMVKADAILAVFILALLARSVYRMVYASLDALSES